MVIVEKIAELMAEPLLKINKKEDIREYLLNKEVFKKYNSILINGNKYILINQSDDPEHEKKHINSAESFWSYCKRRLAKFNGIKEHEYYLHIKESEFRWNHRNDHIYNILISIMNEF